MLGNADGSRTCHVHATLGTYLAVPGESVGHALLDVYTEQSPWQLDTSNLISIVDTSVDFPENGKHDDQGPHVGLCHMCWGLCCAIH